MNGFYLLCGHLLGDYILQNDWQAGNKTNPLAGPRPGRWYIGTMDDTGRWYEPASPPEEVRYTQARNAERRGHLACAVHCLLYTLAVWLCSFWWMPLWGLLVCFAAHFPIDRFRLARKWMTLAGQEKFATGPLSPWSVVVVDNTIHLLTLAAIAAVAHP